MKNLMKKTASFLWQVIILFAIVVLVWNIIFFYSAWKATASTHTIAQWNSCNLTYQINYTNVTTKEHNNIKKAIRHITKNTGIKFTYKGSTKHMPTIQNVNPKANITIAFPKKKQSNLYYKHGGQALVNYVNGRITDAAISIRPKMTKYPNITGLYLHELIHTIGYHNHINNTTSIMNPTIYVNQPSQSDKKMLETIGREMGCKK